MKKFWKKTEGFTLVELVVVIAILGILAGVGTVGYTGYVEKANMAADQALVRDVKNALELAYYADPATFKDSTVVLSLDKEPEVGGDAAAALASAFGSGWAGLRLQYGGWTANFGNSGFGNIKTSDIIEKVGTLTNALSAALSGALDGGSGFESYMADIGVESEQEKANAAVFYVADLTAGLSQEDLQTACGAMVTAMVTDLDDTSITPRMRAERAMGDMQQYTHSRLSSAALMYAVATGYAEYYDELHKNDVDYDATTSPSAILNTAANDLAALGTTDDPKDALDAFEILSNAFMAMSAVNQQDATDYIYNNGRVNQDLAAYSDMLKTVSSTKGLLLNPENSDSLDLTSPECFKNDTIDTLLTAYADGGVMVFMNVAGDSFEVSSTIDG